MECTPPQMFTPEVREFISEQLSRVHADATANGLGHRVTVDGELDRLAELQVVLEGRLLGVEEEAVQPPLLGVFPIVQVGVRLHGRDVAPAA